MEFICGCSCYCSVGQTFRGYGGDCIELVPNYKSEQSGGAAQDAKDGETSRHRWGDSFKGEWDSLCDYGILSH